MKYTNCIKEYLHCVKRLFSTLYYDSVLNGLVYSYWKPLGHNINTAPIAKKIEREAWAVLGWMNEKKPLNKQVNNPRLKAEACGEI